MGSDALIDAKGIFKWPTETPFAMEVLGYSTFWFVGDGTSAWYWGLQKFQDSTRIVSAFVPDNWGMENCETQIHPL